MRIRAQSFAAWMQANFNQTELRDIATYGADTGWPGLTYYHDTCKLYQRFKEEIWTMLTEDAEDFGYFPLQLIASFNQANAVTSGTQFENLLTWYAAERFAHQTLT